MAKAIYLAYLSAATGNNIGMFCIGEGIITGADFGGLLYDGNYQLSSDASRLDGVVKFTLRPGTQLITGAVGGPEPVEISVPLSLPIDFANGQTVSIPTPVGPLNARFEKLRDL